MRPWTDEQVWEAFDAWRWIPPTAIVRRRSAYELIVTPGTYALTYAYGVHVDPSGDPEATLDELRHDVEALGGTGVRVQLSPRATPADLADRLRRRRYRPIEDAEVLVYELRETNAEPRRPPAPTPEEVTVGEVRTDREYEEFTDLSAPIFGEPPISPEQRTAFLEAMHRSLQETGHSNRYLARLDGTPVGRAGMEIVGPVARLWGTGVLPAFRRRGIYGALVRYRADEARDRGAEVALVVARVGTSGPILKKLGFRPVGSVHVHEIRWDEAGPPTDRGADGRG